jgi:hypothetical protein
MHLSRHHGSSLKIAEKNGQTKGSEREVESEGEG